MKNEIIAEVEAEQKAGKEKATKRRPFIPMTEEEKTEAINSRLKAKFDNPNISIETFHEKGDDRADPCPSCIQMFSDLGISHAVVGAEGKRGKFGVYRPKKKKKKKKKTPANEGDANRVLIGESDGRTLFRNESSRDIRSTSFVAPTRPPRSMHPVWPGWRREEHGVLSPLGLARDARHHDGARPRRPASWCGLRASGVGEALRRITAEGRPVDLRCLGALREDLSPDRELERGG
ncbi:uncharacterized protein SOCEGT47_018750 [Sorangium cellulosum]|uniref:Uncharacterized protein n=1 Tax=Sorangium cellulosum TaxID=56 RepID=A0A4P2PY05_SORCE|nr:uncharacterized protein SOCEGT47_018750 [Sorangium cellulosum]